MNEAGVAPPGVIPIQQPTSRTAQRGDPPQEASATAPRSGTPPGIEPGVGALEGEPLLHRQQDLADAEQADHGDQKLEPTQQLHPAEGQAELTRDDVETRE